MSPTHIHLLLNHFPTIGFIIGIVLFVAALIARSDHLKVASLVGQIASELALDGQTRAAADIAAFAIDRPILREAAPATSFLI